MPNALATLIAKVIVGAIASATGVAIGSVAAGVVVSVYAASIIASLAIITAVMKAMGPDMPSDNADSKRDINLRSGTEGRKIVYGEALVGGVLAYSNIGGNANGVLTSVIVNAGHEVSDMTDVYLDASVVTDAQIGAGAGANSGLNAVTSGDYYSATTSLGYVAVDRRTGSPTQTTNAVLNAQFGSDFDTNDRGRNIAYTLFQLSLYEISEKMFESGAPQAYKTLIQGKLVYDPSADASAGADMIANGFSSATYKSYSTNPILCAIDYLIDDRLGMAINPSKIDWDEVVSEAAYCDKPVVNSVTGERESRFTCNGVLSTYDAHQTNILRILTSCNGSIAYKNGKWFMKAGRYGQGADLVANGDFVSGDTSWTKFGTGTAGASSERMECIATTTKSGRYQALTGLTVGSRYVVTGLMENLSVGASSTAEINVTTAAGDTGTTLAGASSVTADPDGNSEFEFIATGTTAYLNVFVDAAASTTAYFDNLEVYLVAEKTVTADWLRDAVGIQTGQSKSERFNSTRSFYFSKDEGYKQIQSLEVSSAINLSRDNQESLFRELNLPMTNTEDESQRLQYKLLKMNERQVRLSFPCNYLALDVAVHDRLMITLDDLSYVQKPFLVEGWTLVDSQGGVDLVLVEDDADYWRDPDTNDYSTRTATGALVPASPEVPPPTSVALTSRSDLPEVTISWSDPEPSSYYDYAQVWRATSNSFGAATLIVDTRANAYTDTTGTIGATYYYWVRSRLGTEYSTEVATSPTSVVVADIDVSSATAAFGTSVFDENASLVYDLRAINQKILTKGFIGLNHNAYLDIARDDGTPAGFYIGRQTGGPAARTSLIGFEDSTREVMKINSGSANPMILTTAHRLTKGAIQRLYIRGWTDNASNTSLDIRVFLSDSENLGAGIVTFCTSPSGNESEVGTATRENGLASPPSTMALTISAGSFNSNFLFQFLDQGQTVGTPYNAKWIAYGIQRRPSANDYNIFIDTCLAYEVSGPILSGSGAP